MSHPNFILLYVDSPSASAAFYADLLDAQPVEASPTFAHVEYFCACGETDQINPGFVIAVVTQVAGTASPLGAMMSADTK